MNSLAGRTFGRYYLLEEIGLGGMATVYKGLDLDTDQKVALKILAPAMARTPQFKARFQREIKLLRTLRHPNIVPILSFGEEDDHSYIVMPYYDSGTLLDRLSRGPLNPREGARIMNQISGALDYAHRQGIVHRDVKPSNILLDQDGNAMLSDFGFAQVQDASISLTGSALIGTPAYMSPEQCTGDPIDAKSDQYSLGVILYQMTTGKLPFEADTPMGLVVKHVNAPLTPPRLISPNLPEGVEAVMIKSMAKDPSKRFASVAEMNRVLQRAFADAFDSQGRLKPNRTPLPQAATATQPVPAADPTTPIPALGRRPWYRRPAYLLATVLLVLACPTAALAFGNGAVAGWLGGGAQAADATQDLAGTIQALSTQISGDQSALAEGQVATAVFQTLSAAGAFATATVEGVPSVIAGDGPTLASTDPGIGSGSVETTRFGYRTSTPTGSTSSGGGPGPTATRTPTPTPTSTDMFTDTPGPSPTDTLVPTDTSAPAATATSTPPAPPTNTAPPPPTNTQAPPPTRTPAPIPPGQCKSDPGHPHYCTPTPG
jgi:serine/threonine-protein kinase